MAIRNINAWQSAAERDAVVAVKDPLSPGFGFRRDTDTVQIYDPDTSTWRDILTTYVADQTRALVTKVNLTTAVLNVADTGVLIAAVPGYKIQLVDFTATANGGNAATATSVRINGTQGASQVRLVTIAIAALTRSVPVGLNSANVTMLADSAWQTALDVNTAVTADVNNNNLATATSITFQLWYNLIPA